ncbi:hypothetical protein [Rhizobium sp. Leaf341]|uniref:hypothetical protein n=1 Tax=Rhizobium sp. Leaf341 TaxID=1736344 RepID=UPI0007157B10|nr:hypothetical protein [Rhizobium sp. Leaf341]KQR67894.1 hypothetical protein ASG03_10260 [Rhizobium sp. Leaf341]
MTDFKVGDTVRRIKDPWGEFNLGDEGVVTHVSSGGKSLRFAVDDRSYAASAFELVEPVPQSLPITAILRMDRAIASAGAAPDTLERYLDLPLKDFVEKVMIPNGITLHKHA